MKKYPSDEQLKIVLDDISPLCFPLLQWIIKSNRAHMSLLPSDKQVKGMGTVLQFMLVNSFPEHERKFQDWKKKS